MLYAVLFILIGYISGGVLYSRLLPKLLKNIDICEVSPDGNPGMTNAFRYAGKGIGLTCCFCDVMKGFLPVFIAKSFVNPFRLLFALVIFAPVLGHATAPFERFTGGSCKGGKAIAVTFGVLLALVPQSFIVFVLALLYILFSLFIKIPSRRTRSIVTFTVFAFFALISSLATHNYAISLGCLMLSALVVFRHVADKSDIKAEDAAVEQRK